MNVGCGVVAHGFEVKILQDIQGLKQSGPLGPFLHFVHINSPVVDLKGLFNFHFPVGQIRLGKQTTLLPSAAYDFLGNVAFVKAIIGCIDGFFS